MSRGENKDQRLAETADEDVAARFPDVEKDERLKATSFELPEVPRGNWKPPKTEASGTKVSRSNTVAEFRGMGIGYTIGLTLVTSILVGTGLGWVVDNYLIHNKGTPWGLIIGFLAGTITGFVQMIQITNRLNAEEERQSADKLRSMRGGG